MNKIIAIAFLLIPILSSAQNDSTGFVVTPHSVTEVGKPLGEKKSISLNKQGGTVKSNDGRVELIITEGALSSKTNISIQPISNHAPGGVGKGYEFGPAGTRFLQPVQLVFHYTKEELEGTEARLKNIATQHPNGKWYKLKNCRVDTINRTISSTINHFSSYVSFDEIRINPVQARVKVGKTRMLAVTYNDVPDDEDLAPLPTPKKTSSNEDDDLAPLPTAKKIFPSLHWFVNAVPNGNSITGTIKRYDKVIADYTAPKIVPDANPVAVTAELKGISFKDNVTGKTFKDLSLVSNITVYDQAYQITVIGIWKDLRREKMGADYYAKAGVGEQIITDTSSFILHVNGNKSYVTDIQNMFKDSIINRGRCTLTLLNEPSVTGIIHISGIESITVTPAEPSRQKSRGITIKFKKPAIVMPDVFMECKGATINNRNVLGFIPIGFPQTISFMESELKDYWADKAGMNEYKVIIRPLTD